VAPVTTAGHEVVAVRVAVAGLADRAICDAVRLVPTATEQATATLSVKPISLAAYGAASRRKWKVINLPAPGFSAAVTLGPRGGYASVRTAGVVTVGVAPAQGTCGSGGMCLTRDGRVTCHCPQGQSCRPIRLPPVCRTDPWRCFYIPFPFCLLPVCSDPIQTADFFCQAD
jgi:hypothetical protein